MQVQKDDLIENKINATIAHSFSKKNLFLSKYTLYGLTVLLLLILPVLADNYVLNLLILSLIFAVLSLSWNMMAGYAGIYSFGHQAFFGIGAYVSALLAVKLGLSPWMGILCGGIVASLAGAIISLPVLRLRIAPYIAIMTLGFAVIVQLATSNFVDLTRGELGLSGIPSFTDIGPIRFNMAHMLNIYYLGLLLLILTAALIAKIVNGPRGLALRSIKDSQDAAESLGVNLTLYKLYVFILSSFIAGVAGAFYAHYVMVLTPSSAMGIDIMMKILVITLIGGIGTIIGPIIGAFLVQFGLEYLRVLGDYRLVLYGAIMILIIMFLPGGIVKAVSKFITRKSTLRRHNL